MVSQQTAPIDLDFLARFNDAWNRHDVGTIMAMMTDDCVFETVAGREATGKRYVGRDAVRAGVENVFRLIPDVQFIDGRTWGCGDRACSEWLMTGTDLNGKRIEARGVDLYELRDGKVARKDSYLKQRF